MANYMELGNMDAYYEQAVKRKMSSTTVSGLILATLVIITVMVVSFYLSFTFVSWFFPLALLMLGLGIYLIYYVLKNSRVEYEYTFVIGELRISRIKGRSKRRTITYFDVKAIDDFGKYIDPKTGKKTIDTSKYPNLLHAAVDDENPDTYYMIIHDKVRRKPAVLLLTPDDRTMEMIRPYLSVPLKKKYIELKKAENKASDNGNKTDSFPEDKTLSAEKDNDTEVKDIPHDDDKSDFGKAITSETSDSYTESQGTSTDKKAPSIGNKPDESKTTENINGKTNGNNKTSDKQNKPNGNRKPYNQQKKPNSSRKPYNQQNKPNGNRKPSDQQNKPNGNRKPSDQQKKPE